VEIQLTPYVLRDPHQLCTAERSPQALLSKGASRPRGQGDQTFSMKKRQKSEALRVAQETAESKLKEKTLGSGLNAGNIGAEIDVI